MTAPKYLSPLLADALDALTEQDRIQLTQALTSNPPKDSTSAKLIDVIIAVCDEAMLRQTIGEMRFITIATALEAEQAAEADAVEARLIAEGKLDLPQRTEGAAWWPEGGGRR